MIGTMRAIALVLALLLALHLATEITPIWQATEDWLKAQEIEPPFWAFAWPGSQAMARSQGRMWRVIGAS